MADPSRSPAVEALRSALRERFGPSCGIRPRPGGAPIPSGWTRIDAALQGGLRPSESALLVGRPGSGVLALASSWAREAARRGGAVLVLDAAGSSLPLAWVEPEEARAPIWALRVPGGPLWAALDLALGSGAFALTVLLEPPPAPPGVGPRAARRAREGGARVVVTQWPGISAPPWAPTHRVLLGAGRVRWVDGPLGAVPRSRRLEVKVGELGRHEIELDATPRADRLRPAARAPDRRPPPERGGGRAARRAPGAGRGGEDPLG